jgi:hypothetical protein
MTTEQWVAGVIDVGNQARAAQQCARALAERLTQHGPADANYARNALIAANIPVPALVEREATGVDNLEQEVKP